ncbi:MAG: hypothetical protein ACK5LV_00945 [Lachnospirales bacterium]
MQQIHLTVYIYLRVGYSYNIERGIVILINNLTTVHFSFSKENNFVYLLQDNVLFQVFESNEVLRQGEKECLQEAFCYGDLSKDLFSFDFISLRTKFFSYDDSYYIQNTMKPIKDTFSHDKDVLLYFSSTMYSIVNLVTVLAYAEKLGFDKDIFLALFNEETEDIEIYKVSPKGYYDVFCDIIVDRDINALKNFTCEKFIFDGLVLFLHFKMENNEIDNFVKYNIDKFEEEEFFDELFNKFARYGLKKFQFDEIVDKYK